MKISLKTLSYQLYRHCGDHLRDVTTDPENKRDCLCCAAARHPSSIFFLCQGGERRTSIFHPDGKQGTHLKVAALAPAVTGRTKFGEDLSGMSDSSILSARRALTG